MPIPQEATSARPEFRLLSPGECRGWSLRHTWREHGTTDWLLMLTQAGSGLYRYQDGGEYTSRPGDVTLYQPGAFQDYQPAPGVPRWNLLWAHFHPRADWIPWLEWPEIAPGLMRLNLHEMTLRRRIITRLRQVVQAHASPHARAENLSYNALEEILLWLDAENPRRPVAEADPRIRRAMDHLVRHLVQPFSEAAVSHAAALSPSRLRHLFHLHTGVSPRQFHERHRLRKARELLSLSRLTIGEVAREVGFASPFYFTLRFTRETGENPRAYRQRTTRSAAPNSNLQT